MVSYPYKNFREEIKMGEKMLVMQALDERDFLKKKIRQKN